MMLAVKITLSRRESSKSTEIIIIRYKHLPDTIQTIDPHSPVTVLKIAFEQKISMGKWEAGRRSTLCSMNRQIVSKEVSSFVSQNITNFPTCKLKQFRY